MSDQGTEEKDLGAQDATVSAGDKPADTRIAPGVTEQNHTESEAGDAFAAQPKKRQLTSRTIGAIAACAVALVATQRACSVLRNPTSRLRSSKRRSNLQALPLLASSNLRPVSPTIPRMVGTRHPPRKTGKQRTKTRQQIRRRSNRRVLRPSRLLNRTPLPGGLGHPVRQRLMHPKTLALPLPLVLRLHIRSPNPNPPLRRRPARFPFTSASIARARKAMAWEASLMAPRSCSLKAPRCTMLCARPALPFPARPIM